MLERPVTGGAPKKPRERADVVATLPVAAITAALWAAGVGLVVIGVLTSVAWAVSSRGADGISTPLRASGTIWLAAHHVPVETPAGPVTLLPLLLLALPVVLLVRAGRWAARITSLSGRNDAALVVVAGTAVYAFVGFLVAEVAGIADATSSPQTALLCCGAVALLSLSAGVLVGSGMHRSLIARLPLLVRRGAVAAATTGAALVAAAGLTLLVALALRFHTVSSLGREAAPGVLDAAALLLVSLAYLPNLLLWALAYAAGPGFAIGGGAVVDPFSVSGGLLPGVPVLGAIPQDPPPGAPLLLLLPVLAGMAGAAALRRRGRLDIVDEAVVLLGSSAVVGVVVGVLCWLSAGALGSGRLADVGPDGLVVGLAVAGLTVAGGLLWSLGAHLLPHLPRRAWHA